MSFLLYNRISEIGIESLENGSCGFLGGSYNAQFERHEFEAVQ